MFTPYACFALALALGAAAQLYKDRTAAGTRPPAAVTSRDQQGFRLPFRGRLAAVDLAAKTISLGGKKKTRLIYITPQTRITKSGAQATLAQAAVGEEVGGLLLRKPDGVEEAVSLRIGPKSESVEKPKPRMPLQKK
jgi:hypothetical protein